MKSLISALLLAWSVPMIAQELSVKIIDRRDSETDYSYVVPGYSNSESNARVSCNSVGNTVNCNGSGTTSGYSTPGRMVPYQVSGATLSLLLPDGRVAVVNCVSKFAERMAGPEGNHRSCRVPIVVDITADFHGDKAKLEWPVSLDGKKMQSETYRVLGILDGPKSGQN